MVKKLFAISEDQAIVEMVIDIPFKVRGRQTRLVPAEWAERVLREFQELGEEAPEGLSPAAPGESIGAEQEFRG